MVTFIDFEGKIVPAPLAVVAAAAATAIGPEESAVFALSSERINITPTTIIDNEDETTGAARAETNNAVNETSTAVAQEGPSPPPPQPPPPQINYRYCPSFGDGSCNNISSNNECDDDDVLVEESDNNNKKYSNNKNKNNVFLSYVMSSNFSSKQLTTTEAINLISGCTTDNKNNNIYDTKRSNVLSGNAYAGAAIIKEPSPSATSSNGAANKRRKIEKSGNNNACCIKIDDAGETASMPINSSSSNDNDNADDDDNRAAAAAAAAANTILGEEWDNNNNDQTTNIVCTTTAVAANVASSLSSGERKQRHTFEERLAQLADYKKHNGDCNVPQRFEGYGNLGGWVNTQRYQYKLYTENKPNDYFTKERICALEKLDFEWRKRQFNFEERVAQLADYKQKNGHCNVPVNSIGYGNLGGWVSRQRTGYMNFQESKPRPLTKKQIRALEKLDFKWRFDSHSRPLEEQRPGPAMLSLQVQNENDDNEVAQMFGENKISSSSSSSNHDDDDDNNNNDSDENASNDNIYRAENGCHGADNEEDNDGGWRDLGDEYYDSDGDCLVF